MFKNLFGKSKSTGVVKFATPGHGGSFTFSYDDSKVNYSQIKDIFLNNFKTKFPFDMAKHIEYENISTLDLLENNYSPYWVKLSIVFDNNIRESFYIIYYAKDCENIRVNLVEVIGNAMNEFD